MRRHVNREGNGKGMNGCYLVLICILVSFFLTGCAYTSNTFRNMLVFLHIQKAQNQESGAGVCLLDPTANIHPDKSPAAADPEKAPSVQVAETSYDFGVVKEDEEFVHRFSVRNVGKAVLRIKKILPG